MSVGSLRFFCIGVFFLAGSMPSAIAQRQVQKLLPSQPDDGSSYARACGMSGDWAITAAAGSSLLGSSVGAAFVSQRINGTWVEGQTLFPTGGQGYDQFGWSVAMEGDLAVIGAPGFRISSNNIPGAAFVFERVGTTWVERQRLMAATPHTGDQFGYGVDISGDRIAVHGQPSSGAGGGQVHIFERAGSTWTVVAHPLPADLLYTALFGASMDLDGDTLAVGGMNMANVYVYERTVQGAWTLQQQIPTPSYAPSAFNTFVIVALGGNTLFVSVDETAGAAVHAGRAHVFERSGSLWSETQAITAGDVQSDDGFVVRRVQGEVAMGHSYGDDDMGNNSGSYYMFRKLNGTWSQTSKVLLNEFHNNQALGFNCALQDRVLMVLAPDDTAACALIGNPQFCRTGAVYFFDLPPTARQFGSCNTATPCSNVDAHGGCRNSTGQGAIMQVSGSGSTSNDDLIVELRQLPPGAPALYFMGDAQTFQILGAGQLRVGGGALGLFRLGIDFADGQGVIVRPPGLVASTQTLGPGAIVAGQTWNLQAWYRDLASTCAPNNLTNGVQVTFGP